MNDLQKFIQSKQCGFLTDADMPRLIELDRLCPVLVRCGGCRFTCGAQYLAHMIKCIEAGGDYVRDVSFPVGAVERAADWRPDPQTFQELPRAERKEIRHEERQSKGLPVFDESQCGGVFDGFSVSSDADPGL